MDPCTDGPGYLLFVVPPVHGGPDTMDNTISGFFPFRVRPRAVPRGTTASPPAWSETSLLPRRNCPFAGDDIEHLVRIRQRLLLERVSYLDERRLRAGRAAEFIRPRRIAPTEMIAFQEIDDRQRACITSRRVGRAGRRLGRFRRRRGRGGERHRQIQGDALHDDVALERDVVLVLEAHAVFARLHRQKARDSSGRRLRVLRCAVDGGGDLYAGNRRRLCRP